MATTSNVPHKQSSILSNDEFSALIYGCWSSEIPQSTQYTGYKYRRKNSKLFGIDDHDQSYLKFLQTNTCTVTQIEKNKITNFVERILSINNVELLCSGYIRQCARETQYEISTTDLTSIVIKYVTNFSYRLKFYDTDDSDSGIKSIDHSSKCIIFNINGNNHFENTLESMKIKMVSSDCQHYFYKRAGYYMQYGIIIVTKEKCQEFEQIFENNRNFTTIYNMIQYLKNEKKHLFEKHRHVQSYYIHYSKRSVTLASDDWTTCHYGIDNDWSLCLMYPRNDSNGEIEINQDVFEVIVKNGKFLKFYKNRNLIDIAHKAKRKGLIKIDFNKYNYYFCLSSAVCSCGTRCNGFEFSVEFT